MKEAIAAWKQRLVHLDLFIIPFQRKAAGLDAARRTHASSPILWAFFLGSEGSS